MMITAFLLKVREFATVVLLLVIVSCLIPEAANALLVRSETIQTSPASTENLWAYYYDDDNDNISSAASYPTSMLDYNRAFQGYVAGVGSNNDNWNILGYSDYRTTHVFSTYITSSSYQTMIIRFGGDDGHALFVNNDFRAGGGYAVTNSVVLNLTVGTVYKLDFVGYNYTGQWSFTIGAADSAGNWLGPIDTRPGIAMDARGDFGPVPEPATLLLLATGLVGIAGAIRGKGAAVSRCQR